MTLANFDGAVFVVDDQAWPTSAYSACGNRLIIRVVYLELVEIGLNFSVACARVHAVDLMVDAPTPVSESQLKDLGIQVRK